MARIKVFLVQDGTQHRIKTKLRDKQILGKSRQVSLAHNSFLSIFFLGRQGKKRKIKLIILGPASNVPHYIWPVIVNMFPGSAK